MARCPSPLARVVPLASGSVSLADVLDVLLGYHAGTVAFYDFACTDRPQASTADHVTLEDIGRVTLMNPRISGADAASRLALRLDSSLRAAVPQDADLADADPSVHAGLFDAAARLHDAHLMVGVRNAKVGKLMQLNRPAVYPVLDSQLCSLYRERAEHEAQGPGVAWRGYRRSYWSAVRSDLLAWRAAGAFTALRAELDGTDRRGWTQLADLRLLDITAWTFGADAVAPSPGSRR